MANEDRTTDRFIREVDEELRREQLRNLWDRFGVYFIGACILVVAATAGYRGWGWWQARQAAERGDRYMAALELRREGDAEAASTAFSRLIAQGGGYAVLARLQMAAAETEAGNTAAALAAYDAVAADSAADRVIRDLARLRAGFVALDSADTAAARARVEPLVVSGNPWRHAARDVLGAAALAEGDFEAARAHYQAVQEDAEAPSDARSRAAAMIALIDGTRTAPAAGDAGGGDTQSPG